MEELDAQPGVNQRADYLACWMRPAVVQSVLHRCLAIRVGAVIFRPYRLPRWEVRIADFEVRRLWAVLEDSGHRMELDHVERATGLCELGDHLRPSSHVGQPAQGAVGGEDDVELLRELPWE